MWESVWDLHVGLGEKVLRPVLVYVFLVLAFRVFGKRELSQSNTLDLAVLLLVANAVQNGIIGNDVSVTGAVVGATVLFALNRLFAELTFRSPRLARLLEGTPTVLIEDGRVQRRALRGEQISLPELRAIARRQGFGDLAEVDSALLETNGVVTMFPAGRPARYHPDIPAAGPS